VTSPIDVSTNLTLKEVEYEMREVTVADWFPLGVQLGIRPAKLREIETDHPGDVWRRKFELLDWWHRNGQEVSWNALAHALEKTGGYDALAQRLKRKGEEKCNSYIVLVQAMWPSANQNLTFSHIHICMCSSYRSK